LGRGREQQRAGIDLFRHDGQRAAMRSPSASVALFELRRRPCCSGSVRYSTSSVALRRQIHPAVDQPDDERARQVRRSTARRSATCGVAGGFLTAHGVRLRAILTGRRDYRAGTVVRLRSSGKQGGENRGMIREDSVKTQRGGRSVSRRNSSRVRRAPRVGAEIAYPLMS
jgi:hypothetical protein